MKVAKADPVIHGLLSEEQRRSREILQALQAKADMLATPEIRWTHFVFSRGPGESCRFRDILEELHR